MYSRWPQVGEPCLQPPPTPKLALAPWCTIHPPPVRKSHGGSVSQALACGAVAVPTTSTPASTTSVPTARPHASLQMLFALSLILCILLSRSGSLVVRLRDTRSRGRDHDVGNAGNNDMKGVHCGGAGG